jgi:hypothetical protein
MHNMPYTTLMSITNLHKTLAASADADAAADAAADAVHAYIFDEAFDTLLLDDIAKRFRKFLKK